MRDDYGVDIRGPILDRLGGGRILTVSKLKNGNFLVMEACDLYFWEELTPDELRALGVELINAANDRALLSPKQVEELDAFLLANKRGG